MRPADPAVARARFFSRIPASGRYWQMHFKTHKGKCKMGVARPVLIRPQPATMSMAGAGARVWARIESHNLRTRSSSDRSDAVGARAEAPRPTAGFAD
jgi:hypothetical protein